MLTQPNQLSPILMRELSENPFIIDGNSQSLILFKRYLDLIVHLGNIEHSGDWDPYLLITFTDGSTLETPNGYEDISFGDFNDKDMPNALNYHEELTLVGFTGLYKDDNEEEAITTYYRLSTIHSIQVKYY